MSNMNDGDYSVVTGRSASRNTPFLKIEDQFRGQFILTYLTPDEARQVASSLSKIADECEAKVKEVSN